MKGSGWTLPLSSLFERIHTLHKVAKNLKDASFYSVDAGMDMHMHGPNFPELLVELVNEGKLSENRVDYACSKILEAKFKLGLFENRFVDEDDISEKIFNQIWGLHHFLTITPQ